MNNDPMSDDKTCPECHAAQGRPFRASMGAPHWLTSYRCPSCGHEWNVARPSESNPLELFPPE